MNYTQIAQLSKVSPSESSVNETLKRLAPGTALDTERSLTQRGTEEGTLQLYVPEDDLPFLYDYMQVSFGWGVASRLALMEKEFPLYLSGPDRWVYKAWAMMRYGADAIPREELRIIREAHDLAFEPRQRMSASAIKSLLICDGTTVAAVAADLGISPDVVEAYEVLFFNVVGRREDLLFLRNVAYKISRLEEMLPEYRTTGNIPSMLIRVGYNSDRRNTLYINGFRPKGFMDTTVDQASSQFQQQLMQTGAVMASTGMLWLDRSHTTISAARSFLQASKLSGETVSAGDGMLSLAGTMRQELDKLSIKTGDEIAAKADGI